MKLKIALYGGTNLTPPLISLVRSLTKQLAANPAVVIISGGFYHALNHPERRSVDRIVLETAERCIPEEIFDERFETWLSKDSPRRQVLRFRKGKVTEVAGSAQSRRFNMVQHADAVITVEGKGNTRNVVELALAIDKPVLPLAFTGGQSKKMWSLYANDIVTLLKINKPLPAFLQHMPLSSGAINRTGAKIAGLVAEAVKKTCLVLMPFGRSGDHFYDQFLRKAVIESDFTDHRIDRNDASGNIPDLFRISLQKSNAVIIDITGYNANVMYELGHVHAKNISPLIILRIKKGQKIEAEDLPFYLRQEMVVTVNADKPGYQKLQQAITSFLKSRH